MTQVLPGDDIGIAAAAALLRAGKLVSFGTETVYGLGADATDERAVAGIYAAKGRPRFNPLICHFATMAAAFAHVEVSPQAERCAERFWPGPLTLVLKRRAESDISLLAGAGLATLAVRVPAHPAARALLKAVGRPVAAPSANRSGGVSPTSAAHVLSDLAGRIAAVLDCGEAPVGIESTVLDLSGTVPVLLRPGGLAEAAIAAEIGPLTRYEAGTPGQQKSPGLLASHYAPRLPVRLDAAQANENEALLAFGPSPGAVVIWNLSPGGDLVEAASRLFAGLRWLDVEAPKLGLRGIAAMTVPGEGLGVAINDRLRRAAAPR